MDHSPPPVVIRHATESDALELCSLLNEIIEIGGTTAIETTLTPDDFVSKYLYHEQSLSCWVAVDIEDKLAGFQSLQLHSKLPDDWADIATFARATSKIRGVGTALFAETRKTAKIQEIQFINATIRADNKQGLSFYRKMGFQTYSIEKDRPLDDGSKVDRISKRYTIIL